jgi:chemotaxis receptor (MCP) glutamine deamidase CheD
VQSTPSMKSSTGTARSSTVVKLASGASMLAGFPLTMLVQRNIIFVAWQYARSACVSIAAVTVRNRLTWSR